MAITTTTAAPLLADADIAPLLITPLQNEAVVLHPTLATTVVTSAPAYRVPTLVDDAGAAWLEELQEIPLSDVDLDEQIVEFGALKSLVLSSNEAIADSREDVGVVVGGSLARKAARQLERAFIGSEAAPAPRGLGYLAPGDMSTITTTATTWKGLDEFAAAASAVEQVGGRVTGWLANPADVLALAQLKVSTGSAVALLAPSGDAAAPSRRVIEGLPVHSCPTVPAGTIYGLDATRTFVVIRSNMTVVADSSAYFSKDATAFRSTLRVGLAFPTPKTIAVVKLKTS